MNGGNRDEAGRNQVQVGQHTHTITEVFNRLRHFLKGLVPNIIYATVIQDYLPVNINQGSIMYSLSDLYKF